MWPQPRARQKSWVVEGQRTFTVSGARPSGFRIGYIQTVPATRGRLEIWDLTLAEVRVCDGAAQWTSYPLGTSYTHVGSEILQFHAPRDAQPPIPGAVVAPVVVARTSPRYSDEALQARYEGRVVLSLTITADGFADDIKVTSSPGMGLDEKAIECVKAWKWRPGMKGGQPAAVPVTVEVNFRLIDTKR